MKTEENQAQQHSITDVGIGQRLLCGIATSAILLLCWRFFTGNWPNVTSYWWYWLLTGIAMLVAIEFGPALIVFWRYGRVITYARSRAFRLKNPNFWTDIEQGEEGGASQMMRMEDGRFCVCGFAFALNQNFRQKRTH